MVQNYYFVLRVKKTATKEEIRRAYRDLAKKYHPDSNHSSRIAEERFKEIVNAYETLKDPVKRKAYDLQLNQKKHRPRTAPKTTKTQKPKPEKVFRTKPKAEERQKASQAGGGGFFGSMFTRNRRNEANMGPRQPGEHVQRVLEIDFEKAAKGGVTYLMIEHETVCFFCAGTGSRSHASTRTCARCHGSGLISRSNGRLSVTEPCPNCKGRGRVVQHPCSHCLGRGVNVERQQVWVNVPEGVQTGSKIRLPGKGRPGKNGGLPGDLILDVKVANHPDFRRVGYNLEVRTHVDIFTATLGGKVPVPSLNGRLQVVIPPGTRSSRRLRLTGKGIRKPDGAYGDLHILIEITPPKKLTLEQRVMLRKLRSSLKYPASG